MTIEDLKIPQTQKQTTIDDPKQQQKISPMMQQWHDCKKTAKDAILLFQMGDFYEAFYDDAILIAKELELTLTKRHGIPMSGIPCHTYENYLDKLVTKGYRVAVASQTENPKETKGLVNREVVRIVTPGTVVNSNLLSEKSNNFFASLTLVGDLFGLAYLDLTTGEFRALEFENEQHLINEIHRLRPSEFLISKKCYQKYKSIIDETKQSLSFLVNILDDWKFDYQTTHNFLIEHLNVLTLEGFGLKGMAPAIGSAGALLDHLKEALRLSIDHIRSITTYSTSKFLQLDRVSQKNLELTEPLHEGNKNSTLLSVLDYTQTPMGGRLLRNWIKQPLLSKEYITNRQNAVETFLEDRSLLESLKKQFDVVHDLERLMMKINSGYASPRDIVTLRFSLETLPSIYQLLSPLAPKLIQDQVEHLQPHTSLTTFIQKALVDSPPIKISEGRLIREGFHEELDELHSIRANNKQWIANYQNKLKDALDIKTLKIGYNKIFGYYIEVSKGQAHKVPEQFQRRQTLVNGERFISQELKDYEQKVLTAEDKIATIETSLFQEIRQEVMKYNDAVLKTAKALANIDCLKTFAEVAYKNNYVRPNIETNLSLKIEDGRHPVIESVNKEERFTPNDTSMEQEKDRLLLITGPNMAGKSTYIRQVALLVIMAQMGSFIPAKSASIGIVDKVFTRIGASDDLTRGQSTFMVEMTETANILHHATDRSLVILDEIGRGTSTYDGISIAWSIAEFLLTTPEKLARTLFATHYWELTELQDLYPGATNYHVAVEEHDDSILFIRKIIKGSTDKSYGIQVGKLAGLPCKVIQGAKDKLAKLEGSVIASEKKSLKPKKAVIGTRIKNSDHEIQFLLFEPEPKKSKLKKASTLACDSKDLLKELQKINLNELSPIQAHQKLLDLQKACTFS